LPRLLNIRSAIRRDKIRRDAEARKAVAQLLEIVPDFRHWKSGSVTPEVLLSRK
jgi:hypothetical protein